MSEISRIEIAGDNNISRAKIHSADVKQVEELRLELVRHCKQNELHDKSSDDKLDKLMPLADLIPTLQQIIEDRRVNTRIGAMVLKWIGIIGAIIGLIAGALAATKYWLDIFRK